MNASGRTVCRRERAWRTEDVSGSGAVAIKDEIKAVLSAKRDDHELGAGLVNIIANIPR